MNRTPGFWLAVAAAVVVGASIVAGLLIVGGPGEARLEKLDDARLDDLRAIDRAAEQAWTERGMLPPSLDSLAAVAPLSPDQLIDPETSEPYEYRVLSDSTAEVCATFAHADSVTVPLAHRSDIGGDHPAGRHCFTLYPPRDTNRFGAVSTNPPAGANAQ
jgi:hypothetical protein